MPKVKLSAALIASTSCPVGRKRLDLWDELTTGLIAEVRCTGKVTFYLRFSDHSGRAKQFKIGCLGDISLDQARRAAKRLRAEIILGGDPLAAKREKKTICTYCVLAEQHIAHAKTYQRSWWSTEGIIRKHLLPRWGPVRLDEVTTQGVAAFLAEKSAEGFAPATVEKIKATFGRSFELGRQWGVAGADRNPVRGVSRPKWDNKRARFLSAAESERLLNAARCSANPLLAPILHLLLLTGARISELLHAEWRHIDLERRTWHIPMSKTGKGRHVPLAQAALDLIVTLPRYPDCPYVLPNPESKLPFVTLKHAFQTARREACLPDVRIHDLRHSCASQMAAAGASLLSIGTVLGHADHKSTMRYAHLANESLLAAVEAGAAKMTPQK